MALTILDDGVKKLQVLLAGAVATSECPMTATVNDIRKDAIGGRDDRGVSKSFDSITTGGTAVDLVSTNPSNIRRQVVGFSLYNDDTTTVVVTVRLYVTASTSRVIWYGSLLTNESLFYTEDTGWHVTDANGARKTTAATDASTADSKAESAATRASTALSAATSLDTATDVTVSTALSTAESAATRASTTLSAATSLDTATDVTVSTALSTATSAGLNASTAQSNETRQSTDQSTMRSLLASGGQAGF